MDSKEFFLRKAIGWALRQYAWTDPKPILAYVRKNAKRLSPLSQREAIKNLSKIAAKPSRKPKAKSTPKSKARAHTQSRLRTSAKSQIKTQRRTKR